MRRSGFVLEDQSPIEKLPSLMVTILGQQFLPVFDYGRQFAFQLLRTLAVATTCFGKNGECLVYLIGLQ